MQVFSIPIFCVYPQVMQAQLDAATQTTRDLRERTAEKDIALDLTASHLQQEDVARRALQDTIKSALGLLHHAAFQVNTRPCNSTPTKITSTDILASMENSRSCEKNVRISIILFHLGGRQRRIGQRGRHPSAAG